jgi:hypothetical protein
MLEFGEQATGVSATFGSAVIGFAAPLENVSAFIEGEARPTPLVAVAIGGVLLWTFLSGGIIDRFARNRATGTHGFFQACGGFFGPLLRLGLVSALVYGVLLLSWRPWLFDVVYDRATRNVDAERTAFAVRTAIYVLFLLPVTLCHLVFDYAKVRIVVEDRLSALGAIRAALGFLRRRWHGALAVYLCNAGVLALVFAAYALVAPGAGAAGVSMWLGLAVGQGYVLARIWSKLLFWASEVEWFLSQLAHTREVVRREPPWPEPPIVEHMLRPSPLDPAP